MGTASVGSHIIRKLRTSLDVVSAPDIRRLIEVWVTAPKKKR
jgi:hypothetical protein